MTASAETIAALDRLIDELRATVDKVEAEERSAEAPHDELSEKLADLEMQMRSIMRRRDEIKAAAKA